MGDDQRPVEIVMPRHAVGVLDHRCEHEGCTAWASFGYSRTKLETRWFCREHRDDGEMYLGR